MLRCESMLLRDRVCGSCGRKTYLRRFEHKDLLRAPRALRTKFLCQACLFTFTYGKRGRKISHRTPSKVVRARKRLREKLHLKRTLSFSRMKTVSEKSKFFERPTPGGYTRAERSIALKRERSTPTKERSRGGEKEFAFSSPCKRRHSIVNLEQFQTPPKSRSFSRRHSVINSINNPASDNSMNTSPLSPASKHLDDLNICVGDESLKNTLDSLYRDLYLMGKGVITIETMMGKVDDMSSRFDRRASV